jgi:protein involved in polysaccharide export with SLBB domain
MEQVALIPRRCAACAAIVLALFASGSGAAAAQEPEAQPPPTDVPSAPDPAYAAMALYPGDVVRVAIWREPDLGGEFLVDERGVITLPMIGDQEVSGLTVGELRTRLVERFRVNLRNPSITVTPMRRVQILGEVNRPGNYTLDPTTTLAGAIAMAMGANPHGDLRRVSVVRDGQVLQTQVSASQTLATVEVRSGDQIFVGQKSWLARNSVAVITAALMIPTAVTSLIALIR